MTFQGIQLKLDYYHNCLSPEKYQQLEQRLRSFAQTSQSLLDKQSPKLFTKTIPMTKFSDHACTVLSRSDLQRECETSCPGAAIKFDFKKKSIIVSAEIEGNLKTASDIVINYKLGLRYSKFTSPDPSVMKYLSCDYAEKRMNEIFENRKIAACLKSLKIYYFELGLEKTEWIFENSIVCLDMELSSSEILFLKSENNQRFVDDVQKENCCFLNWIEDGPSIIGLKEDAMACKKCVDDFLKTENVTEKYLPLCPEKVNFMKQFCEDALTKVKSDSMKCGGLYDFQNDKIILKGPKTFLSQAYTSMKNLSDKIHYQESELRYNGVEEFLTNSEGAKILKAVGDKCGCVIVVREAREEKQTKLNQPSFIADCDLNSKKKIKFYQGDFWALDVDALVNIVTGNGPSTQRKPLFICGGEDVVKDFQAKFSTPLPSESIIVTTGGNLQCKEVFHIFLDIGTGVSISSLRNSLKRCLMKAKLKDHRSVAFPHLGRSKIYSVLLEPIKKLENTVSR